MSKKHKELVVKTMQMIENMSNDTSVDVNTIKQSLLELKEEIEMKIEVLNCDDDLE